MSLILQIMRYSEVLGNIGITSERFQEQFGTALKTLGFDLKLDEVQGIKNIGKNN